MTVDLLTPRCLETLADVRPSCPIRSRNSAGVMVLAFKPEVVTASSRRGVVPNRLSEKRKVRTPQIFETTFYHSGACCVTQHRALQFGVLVSSFRYGTSGGQAL